MMHISDPSNVDITKLSPPNALVVDYAERFQQMAKMRRAGKNDQEIARAFGNLSRERVRQILLSVPRPEKAPRRLRTPPPPFPCDLCGKSVRRSGQSERARLHLCVQHAVLRSGLWRLIDENYFEQHRKIVQRSSGRESPTYPGLWQQRDRRWLNRGSAVHQALMQAFFEGRPIIQLLPPIIQAQLEADAAALASPEKETDVNV